jgi:metallo-beta-lactamase family protein
MQAGMISSPMSARFTPHPQKVFVVHGEERQSLAFAMRLKVEFPVMEVEVPRVDSTHDV